MSLEFLLNALQILSLALIAGGTIVIGALVAPTSFKHLSKIEAGSLVTDIFDRFSQWTEVAALVLFISKITELALIRKFSFDSSSLYLQLEAVQKAPLVNSLDTAYLVQFLLVLVIFALSLYISLELMPKIMNAYENDDKEFKILHSRSEKLFKINFVLAALALILFF